MTKKKKGFFVARVNIALCWSSLSSYAMSDDVFSSPHIGWVKMEDSRPLSAKEKRQEQLKRWENSATDLECETYANPKIKVKFDEGAVFLAACSSGDLDEVKKLLNKGADINFANVDGLTALHQVRCFFGITARIMFSMFINEYILIPSN